MLWDWEKSRLLSTCSVGLNIPKEMKPRVFQISFSSFDYEGNSILLTGPCNTFKYLKKDVDNNLVTEHTQMNNMHQGVKVSTNFTCHAWSKSTGDILVCTDAGEMIICETTG